MISNSQNFARWFILLMAVWLTPSATAATCLGTTGFVWDAATPLTGQTIDGTEILVDGAIVGTTATNKYPCADLTLDPGAYTMTVRHFGIVDGLPATSADSNPLAFTIAQQHGVPGVAPELRFHPLDRATGAA